MIHIGDFVVDDVAARQMDSTMLFIDVGTASIIIQNGKDRLAIKVYRRNNIDVTPVLEELIPWPKLDTK